MRELLEWFCNQCRKSEPELEDFRAVRLGQLLDEVEDASVLGPLLKGLPFPKSRTYWLEEIETGAFLMSGSAGWRLVRGKGGRSWRVYSHSADFYPDAFAEVGVSTSGQVRDEAEAAGYHLTLRDWIAMGWRP
jgi:hypothetical protein